MAGLEELLTGRVLADRYRIEEVIGRGGMAAVYRATDLRLEREVAVKVVTLAAPDPEQREHLRMRFQHEAKTAASIHHPNVVTTYDFGTDPDTGLDFLVMELLRGEDLASRLAGSGPPPLVSAVKLLRDAARGLAAGHQLDLIHRDVKPGNIFLASDAMRDDLRVVVLDFGIAQLTAADHTLTHLTVQGSGPLSPAYASPEQIRGDEHLTPATDVFSLGVVGYQLLTGERLFEASREGRRSGDGAVTVPPMREHNPVIPGGIEAIINRALSHDPEQRFPDAGALAEALEAASGTLVSAALSRPSRTPPAPVVPAPVIRESHSTTVPSPPAPAPRVEHQIAAPAATRQPPRGREPATHRAPARRWSSLAAFLFLAVVGIAAAWWLLGRSNVPTNVQTAEVPDADSLQRQTAAASETAANAAPAPAGESSPVAVAPADPIQPAPGEPPPSDVQPGPTRPIEQPAAPTPTPTPTQQADPPASSGEPAAGTRAPQLNAQGLRALQQGDFSAAADRFRRATEQSPGSAEYRNNYGWALFRLGDIEAADREIQQVIRQDPQREIAYANLGEVRLAQGDTAAAIAMYERFLELNKDPRRRSIAEDKLRSLRSP